MLCLSLGHSFLCWGVTLFAPARQVLSQTLNQPFGSPEQAWEIETTECLQDSYLCSTVGSLPLCLRRADSGCLAWNSSTWEVVGREVQSQPWVYKILTQKKQRKGKGKCKCDLLCVCVCVYVSSLLSVSFLYKQTQDYLAWMRTSLSNKFFSFAKQYIK